MISESVLRFFQGKNALVTGGTGLIGREVVRILLDAGASVKIASLDKQRVDARADHVIADLCNFQKCLDLVSGMDVVFHVAGIKGSIKVTVEQPASFFVPLLMMNTNMLEACRIKGVEKAVYTSSIGAYASGEVFVEGVGDDGPPMDMFPGTAKRIAEQQILAYKIQYGMTNIAIVRPANVYGPGDNFDPENAMVIPSLMWRIFQKENPVVIWGDGLAVRDFAYSRDIAEGIILALYHGTGGSYVNLGSGVGYTIRELVETLNSFIDFRYKFDTSKSSGFPRRVMDITKARQLINYNPSTSLKDGLKETWDWFVSNSSEYLQRHNYFGK